MTVPENILRIISKIFDGNCILFTGAGFSMSSKNLIGENLKNANQLKDALFDMCNLDHTGTLDWAVESYIDMFSEKQLIITLRNFFIVREPSQEQKVLIEQNWKGIYTTNYDNLIETIFSDALRQVRSTT